MDSVDKAGTIVFAIVFTFLVITVCSLSWVSVEKAKIKAQQCEQCRILKKGK